MIDMISFTRNTQYLNQNALGMQVFLIGSHPICCYVREIADCSFNVNSNGQCIPQNYVLDEQIFINI